MSKCAYISLDYGGVTIAHPLWVVCLGQRGDVGWGVRPDYKFLIVRLCADEAEARWYAGRWNGALESK